MNKKIIKYGISEDWIDIVKVEVIKETPKKIRVIKITKYGIYERYITKEWFKYNFFDNLKEVKLHLKKIIESKKLIAKNKYESSLKQLNNKEKELLQLEEKEFNKK